MAFAVYGIAVVTAPAIGPTLGGWITDNFSWRWIFFINIPVGILSILLTSRLIQDPPYFKRRKLSETKIDYVGLGFVALGLGALQIVLDKGQRDDWFESHFIVILTTIAAAALIVIYADFARLQRPASRNGSHARRIYHHAAVASGGISLIALQPALVAAVRLDRAVRFVVSHDQL